MKYTHNLIRNLTLLYRDNKISFAPLSCSWEITYKCNLRCKHCYNQFSNKSIDTLCLKDKKRIVDQLHKLGVIEITLCGGEPLLDDNIIELIDYIKSKGLILYVLTNGLVLNDSLFKVLSDKLNEEDTIQISIDEIDKMPNKQRGLSENQIKILSNNIKRLTKLNCNILANITITKLNQFFIMDIVKYIYELGIKQIGFTPFVPLGGKQMDKLRPNHKFLYDLNKEIAEYCMNREIKYLGGAEGHACEAFNIKPTNHKFNFDYWPCDAGRYKLHLSYYGDLYPCVFMNNEKFKIGSIFDCFENIKDNALAVDKNIRKPLSYKCLKCDRIDMCGGGCPGLVYDRYADLNHIDPRCSQ